MVNYLQQQAYKLPTPSYFWEFIIILAFAIGIYLMSSAYDLFEHLVTFVHRHETWDIDEILIVTIYFVAAFSVFAWRRIAETKRAERALHQRMEQLDRALREVRQLKGIIPICASCKNIRDDQGYWHQVESYIHEHSGADFSHGICPICAHKLLQHAHEQTDVT